MSIRMRTLRYLGLISALFLFGCATRYQAPPDDVPSASLMLMPFAVKPAGGTGPVYANFLTSADCKDRTHIANLEIGKPQTIKVASGARTVLELGYVVSRPQMQAGKLSVYPCSEAVAFIPETGASYRVSLDQGVAVMGLCRAQFDKYNAANARWEPIGAEHTCTQNKFH